MKGDRLSSWLDTITLQEDNRQTIFSFDLKAKLSRLIYKSEA